MLEVHDRAKSVFRRNRKQLGAVSITRQTERATDRDRLVDLLSAKSPRFIAASALELEIASLEIEHPL